MEGTFIEERLAAATAIPASQRSPEVAAFIEACQLQQDLAKKGQGRRSTRKQQALDDLKLVKSHFLSIAPLCYRPGLQLATWHRMCSAAKITDINLVGHTGSRVMELLQADFSIGTLLLVVAGVSTIGLGTALATRLLPVYNSVVKKMQFPAVAACLRQELELLQAGLPSSLLSYEQLLAVFVTLVFRSAGTWRAAGVGACLMMLSQPSESRLVVLKALGPASTGNCRVLSALGNSFLPPLLEDCGPTTSQLGSGSALVPLLLSHSSRVDSRLRSWASG